MKKPTYKGKELLSLSVIDAACNGDSQAVEQVLRYYEGYINKLCTRTLYDPDDQHHVRVDEYMKRRLEIKLIHSHCQHELISLGRKRKQLTLSLFLSFVAGGSTLTKKARWEPSAAV